MELTSCPECGSVAEVTRRFVAESTDGPVEHVKLRCLQRHWFMGPAASLLPDRLGQRVRAPSRDGSMP
jgi:hypothetical protein